MASRTGVVQRGAVKLDCPINFRTSSFKSQLPPSQSPGFEQPPIRLRPRNAEEMMADVAQTSALHHVAFGLLGWQLLLGLFLGPTRAPSPTHAGPPHSGSLALFKS
ncbi:armadillo repeat-containing kinesin-like protein 2 [Pyrus ussuriensis x Pyrus communis]|uniref:Armadillo repeat-containing kinesin-like protein 2 n=1 Tax=Pyrus ussuriensis x Pyrus communis TaxID=2448454 RepID=A0A5N5HHR4_9ROSA|nr:armadillo repeat-containing kinesin-like protein 2 [Pyrus ussuriensis x Pyrus communis]